MRGRAVACIASAALLAAAAGSARAQIDANERPALARIGAAVIAAHAQHADPRTIERRWNALLPPGDRPLLADTLDGRVLLACSGGSMNQVGLAVVTGDRVVLSRPAPESLELSDDWTEPRTLVRVFLVRPGPGGTGAPGAWCGLLWFGDMGTTAPYVMRVIGLEPFPAMASITEVLLAGSRDAWVGVSGEGSSCDIVSRRGEVRFRTFETELRYQPDTHFAWKAGDAVPVEVVDWRLSSLRPFRARAVSVRQTTRPAPGP